MDAKISDKKTSIILNEELNKLGEEGWELVNFAPVLIDARHALIFKRPKE